MPRHSFAQESVTHSRPGAFALYPLAQLAAAFASGILAESYFAVSVLLLISSTALVTSSAAIAVLANIRGKNSSARRGSATMLVMFAVFMVGATLESIEQKEVPANQLRTLLDKGAVAIGEPVELTGVLERDPEIAFDRLYLQLRLEGIRARSMAPNVPGKAKLPGAIERDSAGVVRLLAPVSNSSSKQEFDQLDLHYGARIRVMTTLERADNFRNPGVSSFTEYLDRKVTMPPGL